MGILSALGLGASRILALNTQTEAVVTAVHACWWLKVNMNSVHDAGTARHPHFVRFSYTIDSVTYTGSRFINWQNRPPLAGQKFRLYYDPEHPENYAVASL